VSQSFGLEFTRIKEDAFVGQPIHLAGDHKAPLRHHDADVVVQTIPPFPTVDNGRGPTSDTIRRCSEGCKPVM